MGHQQTSNQSECCAASSEQERLREHIRILVEERKDNKAIIARLTEALERLATRVAKAS